MLATTTGWDLDLERGPGCLFIRLRPGTCERLPETSLAERIWALLEQHLAYCLVLEMDEVDLLDSDLLGQIAALASRIDVHDGMVRLCGVSPESRETLHRANLSDSLPAYSSRQDAMFGRCGPCRPR
jgi:anti-anti-sigma factor